MYTICNLTINKLKLRNHNKLINLNAKQLNEIKNNIHFKYFYCTDKVVKDKEKIVENIGTKQCETSLKWSYTSGQQILDLAGLVAVSKRCTTQA